MRRTARHLAQLVEASQRHARWVVLVALVLTAVALTYAAGHLRIDTDTDKLLDSDLPFLRTGREFQRAFPHLAPGTYGLHYKALATAGHITEETIRFHVVATPWGAMEQLANFADDTLGGLALIGLALIIGGLAWGVVGLRAWRPSAAAVEGHLARRCLAVVVVAALSAQPPAVDLTYQRASLSEVAHCFTPKWPHIHSPSHAEVEDLTARPVAPAFKPPTQADVSWSKFNHNVAGIFIAAMALLTHSHGENNIKLEYLIEVTHTAIAVLAVLMACGRWLELHLDGPAARLAGTGADTAFLLIGAILMFYREPL